MRYHVRIHETRGYSFYVEAESVQAAQDDAWDQWQEGSYGNEDEEESINTEVASVLPIKSQPREAMLS